MKPIELPEEVRMLLDEKFNKRYQILHVWKRNYSYLITAAVNDNLVFLHAYQTLSLNETWDVVTDNFVNHILREGD